jgi:hypothetical protein
LLYENQSYISSHLTSKERHGLQKKKEVRENKRAKSSSVLKREREKKKRVRKRK